MLRKYENCWKFQQQKLNEIIQTSIKKRRKKNGKFIWNESVGTQSTQMYYVKQRLGWFFFLSVQLDFNPVEKKKVF